MYDKCSLISTAQRLGLLNIKDSDDFKKSYLLELAEKNPRVFGILCDADSLVRFIESGQKLF